MKKIINPVSLAAISACLIFITDLLFFTGIAIGILYLFCMVLVINEKKRTVFVFAIITTALIVAEMFFNYEKAMHYGAYADMALSIAVIWISYPVLLKYNKLNKEKIRQEKRYHKMVDGLIEGAQIIGFDWKYLYVNDAAVAQSKFTREELIGYTMMEKYPGIENSVLFKAMQCCMFDRKTEMFENEFRFPDGSSGFFLLSIQPVPDGIFILSMDVSEGRRREQNQKQYISELEEMIYMTSHKVRQPVAHILGFSNMLHNRKNSEEELKQISAYMKQASVSLDNFTKELTEFIHSAKEKNKT